MAIAKKISNTPTTIKEIFKIFEMVEIFELDDELTPVTVVEILLSVEELELVFVVVFAFVFTFIFAFAFVFVLGVFVVSLLYEFSEFVEELEVEFSVKFKSIALQKLKVHNKKTHKASNILNNFDIFTSYVYIFKK